MTSSVFQHWKWALSGTVWTEWSNPCYKPVPHQAYVWRLLIHHIWLAKYRCQLLLDRIQNNENEISAQRDANTAHWLSACINLHQTGSVREGSGRAKNFRPTTDPFLGAQDGQNLISWRWSLPSPTNAVWWTVMHALLTHCGNRPINKQTHKQTNTQTDRTNYNTLSR